MTETPAPTEDQMDRVRAGWALAAPLQDQVARSFYANLFRIDPETQAMFKGDMKVQGRKLTNTLGFIIDHLDEEDVLMPAARELAIRHVNYGVVAAQYGAVGQALLQTLTDMLGADFTAADHAAWASVYGTLTREMLAAVGETT